MLPFDEEQQIFNKSPLDEETLLSGQFWGELRVFLAVAKTKSFNRAAEITNTSQPTVSRQVKRLQDAVGSQLFISTPRGVKLTQKGRSARASLVAARPHALFHHQRPEGGDPRSGRNRAGQYHGRAECALCRPALIAVFGAISKNSIASEEPDEPRSNLRENQTDMMIGFIPSASSDIQFQKARSISFHSNRRQGLHPRITACQRLPIWSNIFSFSPNIIWRRTGLWDSWQQAVARGRIAHYCDNSLRVRHAGKNGARNWSDGQLHTYRPLPHSLGTRR